ncbi:MAG: immunoglobulin-like domain-containing protein [Patescibacteria group bacterium]
MLYTGYAGATIGATTINNVGNYITILWDHSSALILDNATFVSLNFDVISSSVANASLNHSNELIVVGGGTPGTATFVDGTISLNPATLTSIAITTPAKLTYTVGDTLDISGLVVTGTYSDATTKVETITIGNVTGFNSSAPATDQVLTITVGGKTTTYTINVMAPLSSNKDITSFIFPDLGSGVISGTNISVEVPFGTNVNALVPTITLSGGTVSPASGVARNFTSPVTYTVTAANSTTKVYTVTVTFGADPIATAFDTISSNLAGNGIANNMNDVTSNNITSFSGLYFEKSIAGVKMGRITFNSALDLSKDETKTFLQNLGTKMDMAGAGVIGLDFSGATSDLSLKGVSATIKFYGLAGMGFTDQTTSDEINSKLVAFDDNGNLIATSTLISAPGTYVGACEVGSTECHMFTIGVNHFTEYRIDNTPPTITLSGTSPINLTVGDSYTDVGATATDDVDGNISDHIVRVNPVNTSVVGTYIITYNVSDTVGNAATQVTRTVNVNAVPLSSAKAITAFSFSEGSGTVNESTHAIAVTVPYGTNVTALVPTVVVSAGASVSPLSGVAQDFTSPVTYTVTAENGTTQTYVVTVTIGTNPDIALLAADKAALVDDSIKGANADLSNITVALAALPSSGSNGSTITWASSDIAVVSNNGQTVVRPAFVASNITITLTATLTKGALTDTKIFTLIVLKLPASTIATITSGAYTVSVAGTENETIINVPFGASKTDFLAALIKGEINQTWDDAGITNPVVTGNALVVTAQDGTTKVTYTITTSDNPDIALVTSDRDALADDSIKGANSDLSNITVALATLPAIGSVNSSTIMWTSSNIAVVSNDGQTINRPTFADGDATITLTATLNKGTITQTKTFTLIVLKSSASTVATVTSGIYTINDGASTITGIPYQTSSSTFLAGLAKSESHQTWNSSNLANPVITGNTLVITAQDGSTTKTYTLTVTLSPTKEITAFSFPEGTGVINETTHTISVNVPFGTDVTTLTSTISITSGAVINVHDTIQNFTNPVTYTVTAADGTNQNYVVTVTVLANNQVAPDGSGDATADADTPNIVITDPDQAVIVTVTDGTDAKIDVSAFITGGTGTIPQISINSDDADIAIPASTVVTSTDITWDGVIAAPKVTTVTLPVTSGETKTLSTAIELGFASAKLSFDNAVRILLPNQAGKRAGYVRPGTDFTEITNICAVDNQATGDALPVDGDCKIDSGLDLVIWTKHFTSFATYTQTTNNTGGSSGGGGGGGSSYSSAKAIATFTISGGTTVVNENNKTIIVTVPNNTNVTALMPSITVSNFAYVNPNTGIAKDFTNPVTYTVTAQNGSTQSYVVTVIKATANNGGQVLGATYIPDGGLIRVLNTFDVYIVKRVGTKQFKRLILNPEVFNSYQHLKWSDVVVIDQATADSFVTSDLVRAISDTKVYKLYPNGDIGEKRWIKTAEKFLSMGFDWDAVYTINQKDRDSYTEGLVIE